MAGCFIFNLQKLSDLNYLGSVVRKIIPFTTIILNKESIMNTQVQRPTFNEAVEAAVSAIEAAKGKGATEAEVLSIYKSSINDSKLFDRKVKQQALTAINNACSTKFTMNVVRAAPSIKPHQEPSLIPTDELLGSVQTKLPGADTPEESKNGSDVLDLNVVDSLKKLGFPGGAAGEENDDPDVAAIIEEDKTVQASGVIGGDKAPDAPQNEQPATAPAAATPSTSKPKAAASAALESPATSPTPTQEKETMTAPIEQSALTAILGRFGYTSVEARASLYLEFLATKAEEFPAVYKEVLDKTSSKDRDEAFSTAYGASQPLGEAFNGFLAQKHPQLAQDFILDIASMAKGTRAEQKSWFSLTGSEGGVRSGWMAAGAALLGAGLETAKAGEITIGSGIGAAVGVGAAFMAAEHLIDQHIEGQFGRYVAAGSVGVILGATGSALGRMAGGAIETRLQGLEVPEGEITVATLPNNNPVKVTTTDFSKLGLMSF